MSGNKPLKNFHVDCATNSGAAEMHTADKHKMAVSSQQKVVVLEDKISYSSAKTLPSGILRTSTWKIVHQAMAGVVSRDMLCLA
jgi:hypothetical protein